MKGKLSQNPPMVMIAYESSDTRNVFLASTGLLSFSGVLSCHTTMPVIGYNGILTYLYLGSDTTDECRAQGIAGDGEYDCSCRIR